MRILDFSLIPNLQAVLVSLVFSVIACSITYSYLPEFIFQINPLTETTFDLEKESEKELNELEDDEKQILPESDQYLGSVTSDIFQGKVDGFPGLYAFTFTPPPELI